MRASRGMGAINPKKQPGHQKGPNLKRPKAPNRVKGPVDNLAKAANMSKRLGR